QLRARRVPGPDGSVNSTAFGPSGSAFQPTGTGTTKPLGSYHQVRPAGRGWPKGGARFGPARSAVPTSAAGGAAALRDAAGARCNWVATATPAGARRAVAATAATAHRGHRDRGARSAAGGTTTTAGRGSAGPPAPGGGGTWTIGVLSAAAAGSALSGTRSRSFRDSGPARGACGSRTATWRSRRSASVDVSRAAGFFRSRPVST